MDIEVFLTYYIRSAKLSMEAVDVSAVGAPADTNESVGVLVSQIFWLEPATITVYVIGTITISFNT